MPKHARSGVSAVDSANHQGNDISGTYGVGANGRVSLNQIALATTAFYGVGLIYVQQHTVGFPEDYRATRQ